MYFKEDFDKFKESWEKLPISGRITFFAMFLTSFMSISSLSENIVDFYGFLASGIELYRKVSISIIAPSLQALNVQVNQAQTDSLIFLTMATTLNIRHHYRVSRFFVIGDLLFWGLFVYLILNRLILIAVGYTIGLVLATALFGVLPFFSARARNRKSIMAFRNALVSLVLLLLSVCVIAAISNAIATIIKGA